ncbi:hypothetical protein DXG03_002854 [Asterophora parasitica]|uniref:Spt5 KOW domain-containing protein n=1 Tax=Asterophora parasitica TaxID=117018 RepID=A0A9P7G3J3_9AGAR|nr:hypothetical protein DXG03_002854 [Asterophora parasitica]
MRKKQRKTADDVLKFLSIEAEEDESEDDDGDDIGTDMEAILDEELAEDVNGIDNGVEGRRLLQLEHIKLEDNTEWEGLLARARKRAHAEPQDTPESLPSGDHSSLLISGADYREVGAHLDPFLQSLVKSRPRRRRGELRPPQRLWSEEEARRIHGEEAVEKRNFYRGFQRKEYVDGLYAWESDCFVPEEAIPMPQELSMFEHSSYITPQVVQEAHGKMAAYRVQLGDSVKITRGDARGATGVVESLSTHEAFVCTTDDVLVEVALESLRKHLRIGDEFEVGADTLNFYQAPGEFRADVLNFTDLKRKIRDLSRAAERYRYLVGKYVRVIKHPIYRDYKGFVKSTVDSATVRVELQATIKTILIHVSMLTLLYSICLSNRLIC